MEGEGGNGEEIIDKALHLPSRCGLFLSDSAYQSQGCGWNRSLRCVHECVCVCVRAHSHANENDSVSPSGIH